MRTVAEIIESAVNRFMLGIPESCRNDLALRDAHEQGIHFGISLGIKQVLNALESKDCPKANGWDGAGKYLAKWVKKQITGGNDDQST